MEKKEISNKTKTAENSSYFNWIVIVKSIVVEELMAALVDWTVTKLPK
jgi:hypothetical protein